MSHFCGLYENSSWDTGGDNPFGVRGFTSEKCSVTDLTTCTEPNDQKISPISAPEGLTYWMLMNNTKKTKFQK